MSIIVSVIINDGIVMAADSATTFANGQIYEGANKLVNLVKGVPVGVMTCGCGGLGTASIATLLKDLRQRLAGKDTAHADWQLDLEKYTVEGLAGRVREFLIEKSEGIDLKGCFLMLRICGYSSGRPQPEMWQVACVDAEWSGPTCVQPEGEFGPRWEGEPEALNRLILGLGTIPEAGVAALGMNAKQVQEASGKLIPHTYETLIMWAAPIQDAIDLARFMVETTKGFIRFAVTRRKTVGGPVEIATITKHEGFRWVQRKLFYPADLN